MRLAGDDKAATRLALELAPDARELAFEHLGNVRSYGVLEAETFENLCRCQNLRRWCGKQTPVDDLRDEIRKLEEADESGAGGLEDS